MNYLLKSKWTSVKKLNGWKHYEVINIFKKQSKVEMICVCKKNIKFLIPIEDLKDQNKWLTGWIQGKKRKAKV